MPSTVTRKSLINRRADCNIDDCKQLTVYVIQSGGAVTRLCESHARALGADLNQAIVAEFHGK